MYIQYMSFEPLSFIKRNEHVHVEENNILHLDRLSIYAPGSLS